MNFVHPETMKMRPLWGSFSGQSDSVFSRQGAKTPKLHKACFFASLRLCESPPGFWLRSAIFRADELIPAKAMGAFAA